MSLFTNTEATSPDSTESVLGKHAVFRGTISTKATLRIDGFLDGQVDGARRLIVGPAGRVEGDLRAEIVVISGEARGEIEAKHSVLLSATARLDGAINAPKLAIEDGAAFSGRCRMAEPIPSR